MFTYFFSLAIIAFEVICCKIFFESFCDSSGENRKYKRTILLEIVSDSQQKVIWFLI